MIRINLFPVVDTVEKTPPQAYAVLGVVLIGGGLGYYYWDVVGERQAKTEQVALLEQESQRLAQVTARVTEFEQRKTALEARITVIERLKANQQGPVQIMSEIIAAIPDNPRGLWLTSLSQSENTITIEGRAFDVPFIADFIASLDRSPSFQFVDLRFWEQDTERSIRFQLYTELVTADEEEP